MIAAGRTVRQDTAYDIPDTGNAGNCHGLLYSQLTLSASMHMMASLSIMHQLPKFNFR